MANGALYSDVYIDIYDDHILLKGYYLWRYGNKRIDFKDVESIREVRLVYFNGLTRHEQVWLTPRIPWDWKIKDRKEGILIKIKGKSLGIGISAENTHEAALLIHKKVHLG